ncbi:MAG: PAS domain S-box protein, partial [Candidatus Thorarchaeota archaeon]
EKIEDVLNNGSYQLLEISESLPGRPLTWHGLRIGPIKDGEQIIGAVIAAYDITDKIAALQALKEGEEKFRGIFEHANDAIILADEEGRILAINAAQEKLFGIKRADVVGKFIWEVQANLLSIGEKTPEHQKQLEAMMTSFFETGTAPWLESKTQGEFIHPLDGSQKFFEQTVFKIPTSKGFMLCSFVWDITEETTRQAALDEVHERYELALKGADLGVWDWNAEDDEMVFSDRWAEILGYKVDEIETNYAGWEKLIHPADIEMMESKWNAHVEGQTDIYSSEHRMRTKDGEWKWVLERGKVVELNDEGGTRRATGTILDITERVKTELAFREQESRYRTIVEQSLMGIAILPEGPVDIAFVNAKFADLIGYTSEELLKMSTEEITEIIHKDDREIIVEYLRGCLHDSLDGAPLQIRMQHRNGSQIWTEVSAARIEYANAPAVQVSIVDITKRHEAEIALRRERNVFRSLAEAAIHIKDTKELSRKLLNSIISSLDFDFGTFRIYNEQKNVLQYSALLGVDILDTSDELPVTPENAKEYIIVQTARTKSPIYISNLNEDDEISYLTRLRKLNAFSAVAIPILDDDENLLGVFSLATRSPRSFTETDKELFSTIAKMLGAVLERKKTEEALQISERRYREFLTDMTEGIGIVDLDERILFANNSFANLLGYNKDELEGMSILDLVNPEDIAKILKHTELRIEGKTSTYTHRFVRKDGEERTVRISGVPSRDGYGQIDGTVGIITDITERVKAEEALKESEQKFRRVFESMPVAMYLAKLDEDDNFTLVDANPASDTLFNLDHSKYLGKKMSEIRMPYRSDEIPVRFREVAKTGVPWVFDHVVYNEDEIGLATQVQVFRTSADTVVSSFLDITERMVQEKEIQRLNQNLARRIEERTAELAAANKELSAFAYSVSHDLRAPLRTVDGFSQALLEDYSDSIDETGQDYLKRVRAAATHMGSLIEDLLALSRVTRAEMDRDEVDLSEIANNVVDEMRGSEPEREVDVAISDYTPARCDRRLIKLAIQNLIENAWKFTSKQPSSEIQFGKRRKRNR